MEEASYFFQSHRLNYCSYNWRTPSIREAALVAKFKLGVFGGRFFVFGGRFFVFRGASPPKCIARSRNYREVGGWLFNVLENFPLKWRTTEPCPKKCPFQQPLCFFSPTTT
jgi:hypothetical protein